MTGEGHGGWYGDPEGHAEAARQGWLTRKREHLESCGADAYQQHKSYCNKSVAAAAREMGCDELDDLDANQQVAHISSHWKEVDAREAQDLANQGELVIAGLAKSQGSGHVAVVYPGEGATKPDHKYYPNVIGGGSVEGRSDGSKTAGDVWNRSDRGKVRYFTRPKTTH